MRGNLRVPAETGRTYVCSNRIVRAKTNSVLRAPMGPNLTWSLDSVAIVPQGEPNSPERQGELLIRFAADARVLFQAPVGTLMDFYPALVSMHKAVPILHLERLQRDLTMACREHPTNPRLLQLLTAAAHQASSAMHSYRSMATAALGPIGLRHGEGIILERRESPKNETNEPQELLSEPVTCIFTILQSEQMVK